MASVTVNRAELFPSGTVVKAYAVTPGSPGLTGGKPAGAVIAEGTVAASGTLEVVGLAEATEYVLAAEVGGVWRYLYVMPPTPVAATARATIQLGGSAETSSEGGAGTFANRIPVCVPVTTTRWRLRVRNYNSTANLTGTAPINLTGLFIGKMKAYATERWPGAFRAAPLSVLSGGALAVGTAADAITPWVEAPAAQLQAYQVHALSIATERTAGGVTYYDTFGNAFFNGATLAEAAAAAAPASGATQLNLCDMRLEYEYVVGAANAVGVTNSGTIGLFLGDSHSCGYPAADTGGYAMETLAAQLALRRGHPITYSGVAGATLSPSAASFMPLAGNFKWDRIKPFLQTPSYAVIQHGAADFIQLKPLAEIKAGYAELVQTLQENLAIPAVYIATLIPQGVEAGEGETLRGEINAWIRTIPLGIAGIVDFDKQVALQATPNKVDPVWGAPNKEQRHLLRGGYMRMAQAAAGALP